MYKATDGVSNKSAVIIDRREMLRVKVKSLAAESRIIRQEEKHSRGLLRDELHLHRVGIVRSESRSACLALGFIKGRTYEQMEKDPGTKPNWAKVNQLLKKYGPTENGISVVITPDVKAAPVVNNLCVRICKKFKVLASAVA